MTESVAIEANKHYLYPSALFVSDKPHLVTTVLGSCISVCLIDTKRNVGGINHFMLPLWNGSGLASVKFGNIAMDKLIQKMERLGCSLNDIEAKVFGGANQSNFTSDIGKRNSEIAFNRLKELGIKVKAQSTGGYQGRKLIFDTFSGEVRMKLLGSSNQKTI